MSRIITVSLGEKLLKRIDEKRDDIPRSRYVVRLIERGLSVPDSERTKYD
jgi:metal-responsive CopG/Arc/MetJ family transcriptional regulator